MSYNSKPISFVVLCSGKGSNLAAIIAACASGVIPAKVTAVISSSPEAKALHIAETNNIPAISLPASSIEDRNLYLVDQVKEIKPDFIVLAGYVKKVPDSLLEIFPDKIINIHPSLLPEFGGKGMYGLNVHKAVIEAGKKQSGLTIHLVSSEYDRGRILKQVSLDVAPEETPESLSDKILALEHKHFPLVIREFILETIRDEK